MGNWDNTKTWYHGSPFELTYILEGSTITQNADLARVFSHKPTTVWITDENESCFKHNGTQSGLLYSIAEDVKMDDVYPHPNSSMAEGLEWLTNRDLRVALIYKTEVREEEEIPTDQAE